MSFTVNVGYDETERRYFVLSSDIPGLNIEAGTFEEFVEAAQDAAPDLIGDHAVGAKIRFEREVAIAS
jgi:predicted RNase H-like HicB family nuclease